MKDKDEIELAWKIWHLMARLNDLIWDCYEDEFIGQYLQDADVLYQGSLKDYLYLDDPDF
jgi:hypothetical protein